MADRTAVLVASADDGLRAQVRLTLGDERFDTHEALHTDAAIADIAARPPELLVLDLNLPGTGALALARTLHEQPTAAGTSVLLLVPRGEHLDERDPAGVDATLAVPTTAFALLRKVDGLLWSDD